MEKLNPFVAILILSHFIALQSLLIQGKGRFNCSTPELEAGLCNTTSPECSPHVMTVVPGKTYRLRIGSVTSLSALSFEIEVTSRHFSVCLLVQVLYYCAIQFLLHSIMTLRE